MIIIRYESSFYNYLATNTYSFKNCLSYIALPFELGVRHLKVAFCDGKQETLTNMSRERIIFRVPGGPHPEKEERTEPNYHKLSTKDRVFHALVGFGETLGYLCIVVPFVIAAVDKFFNKPKDAQDYQSVDDKPVYEAESGALTTSGSFRVHEAEFGALTASGEFTDPDTGNFYYLFGGIQRRNPFMPGAEKDPFYQNASWLKGKAFER